MGLEFIRNEFKKIKRRNIDMKISEKIKASHDEIVNGGKTAKAKMAEDLGVLGAIAMFDGIRSRKWKEYMQTYACNQKQLERLCGEDQGFLADDENKRALAYIVGNSICTIDTRFGDEKLGTLNYLTPTMIEALDDGIDPTPGP
jgi:hypothetical protein